MNPSTATRPTLLVAAPMLYHPGCGNGGGVMCFELLRRLGERADVHFVAFAAPGEDTPAARAALSAAAQGVHVVPLPPLRLHQRGPAGALLQLASGVPREVRSLRSAAMRRTLAEVAARVRPQAALLQFPHMAQYIDAMPGVPVIMDVQDACMVSRYREWRAARPGLQRWLLLHTWWAWARHEVQAYGRAQRLMAVSDIDQGVFKAYVPQVPSFINSVAWEVAAAPAGAGEDTVLFMGNFAHAPNRDGLQWLLAEVWPRVRAARPQARLQLVGPQLPPGLGDAAQGIQALGFVDDVKPLLAGASLSLVPYRFGGGIKIKAVEAMAAGCPLVATTPGSEGLGARDGVHLRVADEPAAFAAAVVELLAAPALRRQLAGAALALVGERFSWSGKVDALLREVAALAPA